MSQILEALRNEKAFRVARDRAWDECGDARREDTALENVDRTDCARLLNLKRKHLAWESAQALGSFRKRWRDSEWMQQQRGYLQKASLAASSRAQFNGLRYCRCRPGLLCGQVDYCPRCNFEYRVRPLLQEYGDVFDKAPFWFAAIPSITFCPEDAGLHYVVRKDEMGRAREYRHLRSFVGDVPMRGITLDAAEADVVNLLLKVPFELAKRTLAKRVLGKEMADGGFATREIALEYEPEPHYPLQVGEVVISHGNILFNSRHRPNWRFALECWDVYLSLWEKLGLMRYGYPDLVVGKAMVDQAEIDRWISYGLKAVPFEKFYRKGLANGCRLDHLNLHFDQTVFQAIKCAFTSVRSPRKYGNLNSDPRPTARPLPPHRCYIGNKPADRIAKRILNKMVRNLRQVPPQDPFDDLTPADLDFLARHNLDGSLIDLAHLEAAREER